MEWRATGHPRLAEESRTRNLALLGGSSLGFALLIALSARIRLDIPGTPVPATLQTLSVLLAGGLLGPWGGVLAVCSYLGAGLSGAPVFASGGGPAYLLGPTGGYLMGFIPAAWLAGQVSRRTLRLAWLTLGFAAATLTIHLFGWAQLAALTGPIAAAQMGVAPFVAFDILKALVAAVVVRLYAKRGEGPPEGQLPGGSR
jgi:biotin transport system substrate-specific component